jgi:hypothetical protein
MDEILKYNNDTEVKSPIEQAPTEMSRQEEQTAPLKERIEPADFLSSFPNDISLSSVLSIENRSDDVTIIHCNNLYDYLKFGFRDHPEEIEKINKYKDILDAFSSPDTIPSAMQLKNKLPEEDQKWIMSSLNACGSAVPAEFNDGGKKSIVIMNGMPTRRMFNYNGTKRNESQLKAYDEEYEKITNHEVRHSLFYKKYGKDLEEWNKTLESMKAPSHNNQKKYHYDRFTKDEIIAHMENDILGIEESELEKSWNHIIDNLQTDFYRSKKFSNQMKIKKSIWLLRHL